MQTDKGVEALQHALRETAKGLNAQALAMLDLARGMEGRTIPRGPDGMAILNLVRTASEHSRVAGEHVADAGRAIGQVVTLLRTGRTG